MESIENNTAYTGGSLLKFDTSSINECFLECQKNEECNFWTFRNVPEDGDHIKNCRFKALGDDRSEIQNVYSGPAFCHGTHEGT